MMSSAERVRRFRDRQRQANPKEPLWRDLTGKLNVAATWLGLGNAAPVSFVDAIEAVAAQIGLKLTEEPPAATSEPHQPAPGASEDARLAFDRGAQKLRDHLPKRSTDKFRRDWDKFLRQLHSDVQHAVEREVQKRLKPERERLLALEQEARAADDVANKRLAGITALMTEEEYNLIRGLLHPDRHPSEEQDRYTRAFEVFKRLKETITPGIPVSVLRARGWAK